MAQILSPEEMEALREEAIREENDKRQLQALDDKEFVNNGQGVIPERVWRNLPGKREE